MKKSVLLLYFHLRIIANAQTIESSHLTIKLSVTVSNNEKLTYSVTYNGRINYKSISIGI